MGHILDVLVTRPFGLVLMFIYQFVNSYGLAIILFTIITKIIMLPLSLKSKRGMMQMSAIQPRINELQKKYKNDKVKLNEEIQKVYQEEGASPTGGCLPTLITFPIMIALYYVVQRPLTFMMGLSGAQVAEMATRLGIALNKNSALMEISIANAAYQKFDLVKDISASLAPINFNFLGFDLAATPSFSQPSMLWLIPILSGATAFLSSYIMQKMQPNTAANAQQNQTMRSMLIMMPLMSVWIGFTLPTSMGVYWITGNIIMTIQEFFLTAYVKKTTPTKEEIQSKRKDKKGGN